MKILKAVNDRYIEIFLKICIAYGVVLHMAPYFYNRSLWVDEAMLVSSICARSFSELVASPLDWGQSAPVGYLFIVKLITMVWNTSEAALRIFSLFSAFICMCLIYALLKEKVSKKLTLWAVAIFSLTNGYIYYSNEAKPYMSDNMFCLLTLYIWQKYQEKQIEFYKLCLVYAILIWFSFSAVFFIAACMIIECIHQIRSSRVMKHFLYNVAPCSFVLLSFLINYGSWLSTTSSNAGGAGYWNLLKFPILPTSIDDLKLLVRMSREFCFFYGKFISLFLYTEVLLCAVTCAKRNIICLRIILPYILAVLLLLVASFMGFYPIKERLLQMCPLIALVIATFFSEEVSKYSFKIGNKKILFFIQLLLFLILIRVGIHGSENLFAQNVYKSGSEVSASIDFLDKNLKGKDVVYVHRHAIPVYSYETGFHISFEDLQMLDTNKNDENMLPGLPHQFENTIYGQGLVKYKYQQPYSYEFDLDEKAIRQDVEMIAKYHSVYLFTSHGAVGIDNLIELLRKKGSVKIVVDSYNTRLYHFVRKVS